MTSSTVCLRETFPQARKARQIGNLHRFFFFVRRKQKRQPDCLGLALYWAEVRAEAAYFSLISL